MGSGPAARSLVHAPAIVTMPLTTNAASHRIMRTSYGDFMRRLVLLTLLFLAAALRASSAQAQACLGLPSFANGSVRVNLSAEFPEDARSYAAGIGAGKHNGLFGNIGGGQIMYDDYDPKARFGFVEIGMQLPIAGAQLCPVAGGYYARGPDDEDFGIEVTSYGGSGGLALGMPVALSGFSLIPNVAVRYNYSTSEVVETGVGTEESTVKDGLVDLGLAIILANRISVQPLFHIPFASDDDATSFGVFVSLALF
jgi:hypothetical protein